MPYRTILAGLICEDSPTPDPLVAYAVGLAAHQNAHLAFNLGVPRIPMPSASFIPMVREVVDEANGQRRKAAEDLAASCRDRAGLAGVASSSNVHFDSYHLVRAETVRQARSTDLVVLQRRDDTMSLENDLIQAVLFDSGRPLILVPPGWNRPFALDRVMVAWDGGSKAARAVGDAAVLLDMAKQVEVVSVAGDPDRSKHVSGLQIARHLARSCQQLSSTELPVQNNDVGATLCGHATATRADLLVMGGYGHSRLRDFVLGGATEGVLSDLKLPILLSH